MIKKSTLYGVNLRDLFYGSIVAVFGAILAAIHQILITYPVVFDWKNILGIGLTSGISYILKNFFSNSQGNFAKTENATAGPGGGSNPTSGTEGLPPAK
jgi:Na+/H+ antiporter NhaA